MEARPSVESICEEDDAKLSESSGKLSIQARMEKAREEQESSADKKQHYYEEVR